MKKITLYFSLVLMMLATNLLIAQDSGRTISSFPVTSGVQWRLSETDNLYHGELIWRGTETYYNAYYRYSSEDDHLSNEFVEAELVQTNSPFTESKILYTFPSDKPGRMDFRLLNNDGFSSIVTLSYRYNMPAIQRFFIYSPTSASVYEGALPSPMMKLSGVISPNGLSASSIRIQKELYSVDNEFISATPWIEFPVSEVISGDDDSEWSVDLGQGHEFIEEFALEEGLNTYFLQSDTTGPISSVTVYKGGDVRKPDTLACLTEFEDVWFLPLINDPQDPPEDFSPYRSRFLGFNHDPINNLNVFASDVNGDTYEDLIQVNNLGHTWIAINNGQNNFDDPYLAQAILRDDILAGWEVLFGHLNLDSKAEIIQISDRGEISISRPITQVNGVIRYEDPIFLQNSSFIPSQQDNLENIFDSHLFVQDVSADNIDDLVMLDNKNAGLISVMVFENDRFSDPIDLGLTGFKHDPENGFQVIIEDVTLDGYSDYIQIAYGEVWIAVSEDQGTKLGIPMKWGAPGFIGISEPNNHWWSYITNAFTESPTLIQINEFGEIWKASISYNSNTMIGTVGSPERIYTPGFRHQELGNWKSFFGHFAN